MKATCRDLGRMDYDACWRLQHSLFADLLARKTAAKSATTGDRAAIGQFRPEYAPAKETGMTEAPPSGTKPFSAEEPRTKERSAEEFETKGRSADGTKPFPAEEPRTKERSAEVFETEGRSGDGTKPFPAEEPRTKERSAEEFETKERSAEEPAAGAVGTVLLVEHPPVYTLGKSGRAENLLVAKEALEAMGARFFHIDRGGDVTFHGPGQLVCYPILDLERIGMGLRDYVDALEEAVIRTMARYGIAAGRMAGASGVWIEEKGRAPRKICAIGVRASRYVTMHGFALNVSTDLGWFARINPCGFTDRGVTSMERETGRKIAMSAVKAQIVRSLAETLGVQIEAAPDGR